MVAAGEGVGVAPEVAVRRCGRFMRLQWLRRTDAWATHRLANYARHRADPRRRCGLCASPACGGCAL